MSGAKVYLVDASPYVFRAFFSLPDSIRSPDGTVVNAVYGFASFLVKLIADEEPTHLALAFDESLTTSFRNEIYPAYKQQRELPPAELEAQLAACREVGEALGIACFSDERLEADDILATLAVRLAEAGHEVVVVSNDKDLAQLVGPRVTFYDFARGERLGPAEVRERWGVEPRQITDLLGLQGDPVDNIPGVPGVGKKTAQALLSHYRGLDDLYAHLDEVPGLAIRGAAALARRLAEHCDQAFLSRRLATAVTDGPFAADLEGLELKGADPRKVDPLFERLGFQGIRDRVPRWI